MSNPVLHLTGIEKTYNKGSAKAVAVLRGVDLTLQLRS